MKIEISIGDAIDKLTILEIKKKYINDITKIEEITKEIEVLSVCDKYKNDYIFFYNLLVYVNQKIWDLTKTVKSMDIDNPQYAYISKQIFDFNQKRFRIKSWFNTLSGSNIKEQKSYSNTSCEIIIEKEEDIYLNIHKINYLLLEYDVVYFTCSFDCENIIRNIFKNPNIICNIKRKTIYLNEFVIDKDDIDFFEFPDIKYLAGGKFGDFIQSLSVVNEHFIQTGRKGTIYLSDTAGDTFADGFMNTYHDTYNILKSQHYIKNYLVYSNETYDINLTSWRAYDGVQLSIWYYGSEDIYCNWYNRFKKTFNVEWGTHKWLHVGINQEWNTKIIINTTEFRWPTNVDFNLLHTLYSKDLIFVGSNENEYNFFKFKTNLDIDYCQPKSFEELCTVINSCKLFIGSQSGPLSVANALHKDRLIGLSPIPDEIYLGKNYFVDKLDEIWPNIKFSMSEIMP